MASHADDDSRRDAVPPVLILPGARSSAPVIRLDQPALTPAGGPPAPDPPMWDAAARRAVVQFLDGTWHLCRVTDWRQRADRAWICELRWGVSGRLYQASYVYDPARAQPSTLPAARPLRSKAGPAPFPAATWSDGPARPLDHPAAA